MYSEEELQTVSNKEGRVGEIISKKSFSQRESFFLHMRPHSYRVTTISFSNTWCLGFLTVFFFVIECVTGMFLMVYYVPSPEMAYQSIVRLETAIPFGWLFRDLHRLCGECMIVTTVLHMIRILFSQGYRGRYGTTWVIGVILLLLTLCLAFSGYLLPWDQLAYWAVTIGTSMVEPIPVMGSLLAFILRGGNEMGGDGLLRFYLLHIAGFPMFFFIFFGIHYYRVSRLHGISPPYKKRSRDLKNQSQSWEEKTLPLPKLLFQEMNLSLLLLLLFILIVTLFYDAPLGPHANPLHTPSDTQAPWFFLWLQGALKIGNNVLMGILLPFFLLSLLFTLPVWGKKKRVLPYRNIFALTLVALSASGLGYLSYKGLDQSDIGHRPLHSILQKYAPDEKLSSFHQIGYEQIEPGIYRRDNLAQTAMNKRFFSLLQDFFTDVKSVPRESGPVDTTILVEQFQHQLKRVVLRLHFKQAGAQSKVQLEKHIFIHKMVGDERG